MQSSYRYLLPAGLLEAVKLKLQAGESACTKIAMWWGAMPSGRCNVLKVPNNNHPELMMCKGRTCKAKRC